MKNLKRIKLQSKIIIIGDGNCFFRAIAKFRENTNRWLIKKKNKIYDFIQITLDLWQLMNDTDK